MTNGTLGIIACPMLEDEMLWSLRNDKEEKHIFLADNEHKDSTQSKLEFWHMPYKLIPEDDLMNGNFPKEGYTVAILMNDLALHAEPKDLMKKIEDQVTQMSGAVDAIACYYALCGNYGWDISAYAKENGLKPTAVFRDHTGRVCDDCVGVAVDGGENYLKLEKTYTGMFFVTPAIAHNWKVFVGAGVDAKAVLSVDKEVLESLGITDEDSYCRWLLELGHYQNYVVMDTGLETSREQFDKDMENFEKSTYLKPIVIGDGWLSLKPAEGLYRDAKASLPTAS